MQKDKRRFERMESLVSVKYASPTGEIAGFSITKDLSEGGVGLPVSGKIPKGTEVELAITIPENGCRQINARGVIAWSKRNFEHWKSRYSAGVEFLKIDSGDKDKLIEYARRHRWIKNDFERALEEDKVPVLGRRGDFLS